MGICLASSTIEIGICLLLPEDVQLKSHHLSRQVMQYFSDAALPVKETQNTPHISLFQLRIEEKRLSQLISSLKEVLKNAPFPILVMKNALTDTQENIFWDVEKSNDDDALNALHKTVVEHACTYRPQELMEQVQALPSLTFDQQKAVDDYGIFWGLPGRLNPHITLIYDSGVDREDDKGILTHIKGIIAKAQVEQNVSFQVEKIAIGKIGFSGNIEEIIAVLQ